MRCVATFALLSLLAVPGAFAQDTATDDGAIATEQPADETTPATGGEATAPDAAATAPADLPPADEGTTPAEAAPPAETGTETAAAEAPVDSSADLERLIVTGVAGGVAVVGLGVGITFGVLALNDYNCLSDVVECNKTLDEPIIGDKYLDARAEVERKALYADMGFLVAATAATVAIVGAVEMLLGSGSEASE
ncbi:MAG: hypothetical protein ABIJ09_16470 [Pseudomonadota bacterium]